MNKEYINEYQKLLSFIKEKLTNNYLEEKYANIYLIYVNGIEDKVKTNPTSDNYIDAINDLNVILDEIKLLDHSLDNNYSLIYLKDKDNSENDKNELEKYINDITDNIEKIYDDKFKNSDYDKKQILNKLNRLRRSIKNLKIDTRRARTKIFAYLLTLSIFLSIPISTFVSIRKKREYKIYYPTVKEEYNSIIASEYDIPYYDGKPIVFNVLKHNMIQEEFVDVTDAGYVNDENGKHNCFYEITEKSPWKIIGKEAVREVRKCLIPISMVGDSIDITKILDDNNITPTKEIIYANEITREERVFYSKEENKDKYIYEIIRYTQNLDYPTAKYIAYDYTDLYIILFSEFLLWLCMVESINETIIEGIINSIKTISNNKKITEMQKEKLNKLYNNYISIYNPQNTKKRTKK